MHYIASKFSFIDNENILLMGDSAGGHLALCLILNIPNDKVPALKPNKIVAYNPVTDCVMDKWSYCADNAIKYSPMHNIKRIDADVLVMHGTADSVVSIEDSRLFVGKLKAVGNNVSMIELPGAKHAFILFGYTAEEKDVMKALELTDEQFDL